MATTLTRRDIVERRDEILKVAARHGAYHVRLFGSVARGESNETSDVDLLVELEPGRSLLDHAGLILDLEALLGCDVDVVVEQGLRPRMRKIVMAEAAEL